VLIPPDVRVRELCAMMRLACAAESETSVDDVSALVANVASRFDGKAFDAQRRAIASRYVRLFESAGLTLNPKVAALASDLRRAHHQSSIT
jgi:hypothetical protein